MQFEVNGQNYFLHFSDEERHWVLFRPVEDGVEEIEIADDTAQPEFGGVIIPFGSNDRGKGELTEDQGWLRQPRIITRFWA